MKNDTLKGQYRINEQIRAKEVRIVGDEIEPKVYPIFQALKMAEEKELDLVEISPNAQPPVCRIIDYSKFLYQLKKRQKEQKAKQVKVNVKEIRFGPQTDDHDYNFKLKHARGFLEDGDKVKAYVFFKGRSILFKEQGEVLLLRFANDLEDFAKVDQMPGGNGYIFQLPMTRLLGATIVLAVTYQDGALVITTPQQQNYALSDGQGGVMYGSIITKTDDGLYLQGKIILSPVLMNDGQVALAYITDAYMSMGLFKGRVPSTANYAGLSIDFPAILMQYAE